MTEMLLDIKNVIAWCFDFSGVNVSSYWMNFI